MRLTAPVPDSCSSLYLYSARVRNTTLGGIHIIRTPVPAERLPAEAGVRSYMGLSRVERVFRSQKTVDIKVRPVQDRPEGWVRAELVPWTLAILP